MTLTALVLALTLLLFHISLEQVIVLTSTDVQKYCPQQCSWKYSSKDLLCVDCREQCSPQDNTDNKD